MTDKTLTLTDIETIFSIWHGKFDRSDEAQCEQAIATYDKLDAIRRTLDVQRAFDSFSYTPAKGAN